MYMRSYGESDQRMHESIYVDLPNFKMLSDLFVFVHCVCRTVIPSCELAVSPLHT